MLRNIGWQLVTEVSAQHIGPIGKGQPNTKRRNVASKKSEGLNYTAVETWNLAFLFLFRPTFSIKQKILFKVTDLNVI
jgi:hypothetical protein